MSEKELTKATTPSEEAAQFEESSIQAIIDMVNMFNESLTEWKRLTGLHVDLVWKYDPDVIMSVRSVKAVSLNKVEKVLYQAGVDKEKLDDFLKTQQTTEQ
jgi:hypothetical protein